LVERLQHDFGPCQVILFGSRARGTHLLTSDADILVVASAFEGMREDDRMIRVLERWNGPVSLQPLCYTPAEFEARRHGINIVEVAVREGRTLA
jgi:predicted nucleotidyltransferase